MSDYLVGYLRGSKGWPTLGDVAADRIEELEGEVMRMRELLGEALYFLDPDPEDILKGAAIYRIVAAYTEAGDALREDLMEALQEMKEKSDD